MKSPVNKEGARDKLSCIIVDDEELARSVIREYLSRYPDIEILAECSNGFEAVKVASEARPDLIFLDIQMPKLTGFEVLELIGTDTGVIFVTAHDEYALHAFDVHAVDYLLKPFSAERFGEALEHARLHLKLDRQTPFADLIAESRKRHKPLQRVLIRDGSRVHVLPVEKIDYVQAQDDYVCFKAGGKDYLKQEAMADLENLLDPARFIRIHRSYILNIERLAKLELFAKDSHVAVLTDGTQLPVSRSGYARLKPLL
ncbi:MAG: LytTR family DNA-binding domain-containing protein [Acidobacteriia bacterium]|nr:LytTR family DNA-binding domain-containing protein [Terriglobia bacterium]